MVRNWAGWMLGAMLACGPALAQTTVEAVQYPAWLERGGQAVPLLPGTTLQPQDSLRTGGNARVQLRLAEGSAVKLGENAKLVIERAEERGGIFRGALSVLAGAFRFTSEQVRKREIAIKVKNVTAGIRGTDLWGKSTDQRDLVCLLEGSISVGSEGHPTVTLDQPLDFYQKPRDGEPSVAKVDEKQIAIWAQETEISPEGPAARVGGGWRVLAGVFPKRDEALALARLLRSSGYPAEVSGKDFRFSVHVPGLAGEAEARALMSSLRNVKGVSIPAVEPMPGR